MKSRLIITISQDFVSLKILPHGGISTKRRVISADSQQIGSLLQSPLLSSDGTAYSTAFVLCSRLVVGSELLSCEGRGSTFVNRKTRSYISKRKTVILLRPRYCAQQHDHTVCFLSCLASRTQLDVSSTRL